MNLRARFPPDDIKFLSTLQLFDLTTMLTSESTYNLLNLVVKHLAPTVHHKSDVLSTIRSEYLSFSVTMRQKGFEDASVVMKNVAA